MDDYRICAYLNLHFRHIVLLLIMQSPAITVMPEISSGKDVDYDKNTALDSSKRHGGTRQRSLPSDKQVNQSETTRCFNLVLTCKR